MDKDTLTQLAADQSASTGPFSAQHGWKYDLDGESSESHHLRPRLTVFVHLRNGVAVDATLSPTTRKFLGKIVSEKATNAGSSPDIVPPEGAAVMPDGPGADRGSETEGRHASGPRETTKAPLMVQKVEVPLVFDGEFFAILQTDVENLDILQGEEQQKMRGEIVALGQEITKVSKPSNGRKAKDDLARWRDIFELYLDARIFFSNRESDHGARTSAQALQQLQWFQGEVLKRKLVQGLKLQPSREAFNKFLNVNAMLLQNLKFQEINQTAIAKILKSRSFGVVSHLGRFLMLTTCRIRQKNLAGRCQDLPGRSPLRKTSGGQRRQGPVRSGVQRNHCNGAAA